jgi:NAD(P)-dependent dehydrogenase (short-subunit alcohol dehydrogenase family)
MYDDLKDKRVVVTGGASGIGLATARRFVKESCQVVILDSNREALYTAQSEPPGFAGGVCADVSNQDEVEAAFKEVDQIMGGIDILISNAGISIRKPFTEVDYLTPFNFCTSDLAPLISHLLLPGLRHHSDRQYIGL